MAPPRIQSSSPPDSPSNPTEAALYYVRVGDSLWGIAKNHLPDKASNADINRYVEQIRRDNPQIPKDDRGLQEGMALNLYPVKNSLSQTPQKPASSDSLGDQFKSKGKVNFETYTAKSGDHISGILQKTGRRPNGQVKDFIELNKAKYPQLLQNPPLIQIGKTYRLPEKILPKPRMKTLPNNKKWSGVYKVNPGDTHESIEKIAQLPWQTLAKVNGVSELKSGQLLLLPPPNLDSEQVKRVQSPLQASFKPGDSGLRLHPPSRKFPQRGHYSAYGHEGMELVQFFMKTHQWSQGVGQSQLGYPINENHQVIFAIARNEGNFSSVNTFDRGILSSGFFQWTLESGGLQEVLGEFKQTSPDQFNQAFRVYGIDTVEEDGKTKMSYMGVVIEGEALEMFRNEWFAHIFSRTGHNPGYQKAQFVMAEKRLTQALNFLPQSMKNFNLSPEAKALVLDQHVNYPKGLKNILQTMSLQPDCNEDNFAEKFVKIRNAKGYDKNARSAKILNFFASFSNKPVS